MEPHAWLVNVAVGRHVVTDDLVKALQAGEIGGAGLDVTEPEPLPEGHPLWSLPNCIITPHVGNTPEMAKPLLAERITANVRRWAHGEPLIGPVDPARRILNRCSTQARSPACWPMLTAARCSLHWCSAPRRSTTSCAATGLDAKSAGRSLARFVESGLVERGDDGAHLLLAEAFSLAARVRPRLRLTRPTTRRTMQPTRSRPRCSGRSYVTVV